MLETLVISSVVQSLPTIYPISIEQSSSSDYPYQHQHPPKKKFKMERVKKLTLEKQKQKQKQAAAAFPSPSSLFAKTAGIFDNMMCCRSYAEQQLSVEATEREREYREEESPGLGLDAVVAKTKTTRGSNTPDPFQRKKVAPVQYDFVDQRSPPQHSRKCQVSKSTRATAPYSPIGSSYSTATTVTANTYNTIDGAGYDSSSAQSSTRSLRTTETANELFTRQPADQDCYANRSLTDRTISVPSRSRRLIKLDAGKRRWSEGCVEFEQQQQQQQKQGHADYYVPNEEVIRKVQSESLAQLPYLSMTEGYRC
jgi:hypothetical protein